ncbi:hypothetical protein PCANC_16575 [Puccinia coronata f. sp. avenae]|uniref:Uncharacterized protein n=1 Tax=Puccinia coronata f. sp. avenae TaxID=200324 RepID=A0A2N5UME9_9BASI|nr:hypothetical protein PCANC_16575 [Puccinia coronata f. sp. avenae]
MPDIFPSRRRSHIPVKRSQAESAIILQRLQQLSNGMDPWTLINPTVATSTSTAPLPIINDLSVDQDAIMDNPSLQDDDFEDHNPSTWPSKNTGDTSIFNNVRAYHAEINQTQRSNSNQSNWEEIMPSLHGAYILLKEETKGWSIPDSFADRSEMFCDCSHHRYRRVDLIDLNSE